MNRSIYRLLALCGLGMTIIPSILLFNGAISSSTNKLIMLIGMIVWFVAAPGWIGSNDEKAQDHA